MLTLKILSDEDRLEFFNKKKLKITGFRDRNLTPNDWEGCIGCGPNPQRIWTPKGVPDGEISQDARICRVREETNQVQGLMIAKEAQED